MLVSLPSVAAEWCVVAVVGLIRKGPPHSSQDGHSPLFHGIVLALNRASLRVGAEKS